MEVPVWQAALAATKAAFEADLQARGFTHGKDGWWTGPVPAAISQTSSVNKPHRVLLPSDFPFSPPFVATTDPPARLTWHLSPDGVLCLFRASDDPGRPWETIDGLFDRVLAWYRNNLANWPDDPGDPDLERYFGGGSSDADFLVTFDREEHAVGTLGVERRGENWHHLHPEASNRKGRRRTSSLWGFGADLGVLDEPVWDWSTIRRRLSDSDDHALCELAGSRSGLLLLHYARAGSEGRRDAAIVLYVKRLPPTKAMHQGRVTVPAAPSTEPPMLTAVETADVSRHALTFRSGPDAERNGSRRVAIVGCGAVGSFTAELLARSSIGHLDLVDPQRLRPGNCVRHLADKRHVSKYKVTAVRDVLVATGLIAQDHVRVFNQRLDPELAFELLTTVDLVIDAAASASVTGLLRHLADQIGNVTFLKVALHREGAIVRVDRYGHGTPPDDQRPEHISAREGGVTTYREAGCGDPVSSTPPDAVVTAASVACRWAIDQMHSWRQQRLPASHVEVLTPQADEPYREVGAASR